MKGEREETVTSLQFPIRLCPLVDKQVVHALIDPDPPGP